MSSSNRGRSRGGARPDSPSSGGEGAPAELEGSHPRHAAITRQLQTWSSYKTWAEQVRDSWESGGEGTPAEASAK